ncbi:hypothetical protein QFC19_006752 [Naganishia cerealis]|uniref:Uncharacterized protein n=1 Tax=Naganishia cerealis TaxID=610337 RepID=A0ACC2VEW4_9TREE|nr:hypothetical protein QFC19_006752 [Naganishia cerealis]
MPLPTSEEVQDLIASQRLTASQGPSPSPQTPQNPTGATSAPIQVPPIPAQASTNTGSARSQPEKIAEKRQERFYTNKQKIQMFSYLEDELNILRRSDKERMEKQRKQDKELKLARRKCHRDLHGAIPNNARAITEQIEDMGEAAQRQEDYRMFAPIEPPSISSDEA